MQIKPFYRTNVLGCSEFPFVIYWHDLTCSFWPLLLHSLSFPVASNVCDICVLLTCQGNEKLSSRFPTCQNYKTLDEDILIKRKAWCIIDGDGSKMYCWILNSVSIIMVLRCVQVLLDIHLFLRRFVCYCVISTMAFN